MLNSPMVRDDQQRVIVLQPAEYDALVRQPRSGFKRFMLVLVGVPIALVMISIAASVPFLIYGLMEANDALREVAVAQAESSASGQWNDGFMVGAALVAAAMVVIVVSIKGGK